MAKRRRRPRVVCTRVTTADLLVASLKKTDEAIASLHTCVDRLVATLTPKEREVLEARFKVKL